MAQPSRPKDVLVGLFSDLRMVWFRAIRSDLLKMRTFDSGWERSRPKDGYSGFSFSMRRW